MKKQGKEDHVAGWAFSIRTSRMTLPHFYFQMDASILLTVEVFLLTHQQKGNNNNSNRVHA